MIGGGGSFLTDEIGVTFLQDPVLTDLQGFRTFLAHGDGLGRGDLGYRILRAVVRGPFTRWSFRWLHPDLGTALGARVSRTEYREGGPSEAEKGRSRALREWAVEELRRDPTLDLIVCGHTHIPLLEEVEARPILRERGRLAQSPKLPRASGGASPDTPHLARVRACPQGVPTGGRDRRRS